MPRNSKKRKLEVLPQGVTVPPEYRSELEARAKMLLAGLLNDLAENEDVETAEDSDAPGYEEVGLGSGFADDARLSASLKVEIERFEAARAKVHNRLLRAMVVNDLKKVYVDDIPVYKIEQTKFTLKRKETIAKLRDLGVPANAIQDELMSEKTSTFVTVGGRGKPGLKPVA